MKKTACYIFLFLLTLNIEEANLLKKEDSVKANTPTMDYEMNRTTSGMDVYYYRGYWGLGGKQGDLGRLAIPDYGISVALDSSSSSFPVWDRASYNDGVIYDWDWQGFDLLKCVVNDTVMYIRHNNTIKTYLSCEEPADLIVKSNECETYWKFIEESH